MSSALTHDLACYFPHLAEYNSSETLHASQIYRELEDRIARILQGYEYQDLVPPAEPKTRYRAVAWNIERGAHLEGIISLLKTHPALRDADLYLITEADLGMARSQNRHIARELASALQLNYYFAPSYLNLSKGCGHEIEIAGENSLGIHGNAILSRYPLTHLHTIALPNGKDKMKGKEKRIGNQRALIADVELGGQKITVSCIHLDAHSSQKHRATQMRSVLDALAQGAENQPMLIGGDWNTSTYNSSRAIHAIIGFWIRVLMGVGNMIRNHYPYPERFWEKELFALLTARGFDYEHCNEVGVGTLAYNIYDIKQYKNLGDWIPQWCFRFIEWSLRKHNGRCSFKLDWFATRGLSPHQPKVVPNLVVNGTRVSDHDAIVTEFSL